MAVETHEPDRASRLASLERLARVCRDCPLWEHATQTVFGEGPATASMVLVGEQPGDREDRTGKPFVGPAGRLLDHALEAAGVRRAEVFVTNAVKHFKWEPRGKRRLHSKPNHAEVDACRPWLDGEIATVRPSVVVCLGATATYALLGPAARVTSHRGTPIRTGSAYVVVTAHPSAILRVADRAARSDALAALVSDLRVAASIPR